MRRTVLHVLPHRGGGAEVYIDFVERLEGFSHERIAFSGSRAPVVAGPLIAVNWPRVAFRACHVDLVHAHGDVASVLALPLLASRPSVMTTQGLHFVRRARGVGRLLIHRGLRHVVESVGCVLCSSRADRELMSDVVPRRFHDRLVQLASGIDVPAPLGPLERASVRRELGVAHGEVLGVFMADLEHRKRPLVAVAAAERARAAAAPFVLAVVGEGSQAAAVAAHAGPAVRVLGYRRDRERLLGAADVFVMPSEREGFSLALLEAMACGAATVVSDGPGNPEVVGDAGIVVALDDIDGLASAFCMLSNDSRMRLELGAAARELVRDRYPLSTFLNGLGAAYASALQFRRRG